MAAIVTTSSGSATGLSPPSSVLSSSSSSSSSSAFLSPSSSSPSGAAAAAAAAVITSSSAAVAAANSIGSTLAGTTATPVWDVQEASQLEAWIRTALAAKVPMEDTVQKTSIASVLWKHLNVAVTTLTVTAIPLSKEEEDQKNFNNNKHTPSTVGSSSTTTISDDVAARPTKRAKNAAAAAAKKKYKWIRHDPFHIWLHEELDEDAEYDDIPSAFGGKLAQLTVAGLMNALSGMENGIVDHYKKIVPRISANYAQDGSVMIGSTQCTFSQLHQVAMGLFRAIETRVQQDVLVTTPIRIQQMLAPDLQPHEFKAIRKRIYDTVILGKGMNQNHAQADEEELPVVASSATNVHDIEKMKKCKICGNNDQSNFVLDRKNGDVICGNCGTVVSESLMHEGSQYRKFEGEQDRNHHGDSGNPLYSNAHNMSTTLSGIQVTAGAGGPGFGSARGNGARGLETILRNAHAYTELNISQFGRDEKRTRVGYKDRQKKEAFVQMAHVGDALNLHEAVIQRAKELFSGFRDDREMVQQFKGVIAACLCEAFDQLSTDGKRILKQQEVLDNRLAVVGNSHNNNVNRASQARVNRRNELHHASLAGKGGILLDVATLTAAKAAAALSSSAVAASPSGGAAAPTPAGAAAPVSSLEHKNISLWDLDDCRTWLLEVSRNIAELWYDASKTIKKEAVGPDKASSSASSNHKIPQGSRDELEGRLVEHTFTLCDLLEQEMKSRNHPGSTSTVAATTSINKRVVTPRVNDLSRLAIKWQHSHERGSGGKGGVGNTTKITPTTTSIVATSSSTNGGGGSGGSSSSNSGGGGPTAGQVLLLKTAKKLGAMLKDDVAGEAFHRELRTIYGRQEAIKKKELRDEATRQRFQQMKRKPWLQARMQN